MLLPIIHPCFLGSVFRAGGPAGLSGGQFSPFSAFSRFALFALFRTFRPRGGPEGTLYIAPNDCDMSAKPLNALNSGTVGVVLGMYMGYGGIYRAQIPPPEAPRNPQKKNPQKIHLLEVPYQVIFPPIFGPRGPGGGLRTLFRCRISLGCEFHHVIYLISSPLYKEHTIYISFLIFSFSLFFL